MILENDFFVVMNHKKIRRIMRKFNLVTKIRQINPYRKMAKATQEHKTLPNLLNREFDQSEPGKVILRILRMFIMEPPSQLTYLVLKMHLQGK